MSRQPLVFTPAAPASDQPDVLAGEGTSEVPAEAAVAVVKAGSEVEPTATATSELPPSLRARSAGLGLDAFSTEREIRFKTHLPAPVPGPSGLVIGAAACALVVVAGLAYTTFFSRGAAGPAAAPAPSAIATGQAQFDSQPSGAEVVIDGTPRGTTPIKLSLPVGPHTLEIRSAAGTRTLPLTIETGVLVSQYVELTALPASPATAATGRLDVSSDPPGAEVRIDGVVRGVTPLTLNALAAREHRVALSRDGATIYRNVRVEAGTTASVMASLAVPVATTGAVGGFLALTVPFEVQVLEAGKLLGSSRSERLMLPTGRHDLELVNTSLQFRTPLTVSIEAGKVAAPAVAIPEGKLSVNALPWAEVFIDGRNVGTTPLANLTIPIGTHEIIWRHPQLGERRQPVTVTTQAPARTGVNFSQ